MIALYILLAALALLFATLVLRALAFKPPKAAPRVPHPVDFDRQKAVDDLAAMIRCKTVSDVAPEKEDAAEFEKFHALLPTLFPATFAACEKIDTGARSILWRLRGKSPRSPLVLMSHYDVVSINEEGWSRPAFEGCIEEGHLWGRGTLDTKGTLNGILQAAEAMLKNGFTPERDVFFAFSGNEEIGGDGAPAIVDWLEKNGIEPGLVIDEGGAVVENVFPGVKLPCALIGIAEKGMIDLEYRVKSPGGHSSAPKPNSPLVQLSRACLDIEKKPFKRHLTKPVAGMFDTLGRHSSFLYRMIFANLWAFGGLLDMICKSGGGELNAMMRTTVAFTQAKGSSTPNVIPPEASMVSNMRLNPMDTVDSAVEYLKGVIDNENVVLNKLRGMNPSRISDTEADGYKRVEKAILGTWKNSIVSPYLMVQCSDSRHWGRISDKVYRFSAMDLTSEERATIHGNNERIRIDCAKRAAEFYIRLIKQC